MKTIFPYELHVSGSGHCTLFELGTDALALPLTALICARRREREGAQQLVLEFPNGQVEISGQGLDELLTHLLAGRVKTIRIGQHDTGTVTKLHFAEM